VRGSNQKIKMKLTSPENKSILLRLLREDFPLYKWRYARAAVFMAMTAACGALTAWIMKDLTNGIFGDRSMSQAYFIGTFIVVIFTIKGLSSYITSVILAKIGNAIVADKQAKMFAAILKQGIAFHASFTTGDFITRISHNAAGARDILQVIVTSVGRDFLAVIGFLVVMLATEPALFFISIIIMPGAIWGVNKLRARVKNLAKAEFQSISEITENVKESIQGIRIVKSYGLEQIRQTKMLTAISAVQARANKIATLTSRTTPLMETLGGFAIAGVVMYGAYRVIHQGSDPGSFFAFLTALLLAYDPAKRLARAQVQIEQGLASVRRMYEMIDTPQVLQDGHSPLEITNGEVVFKDVSFAYGEKQVLEQLSFTAKPSQTLALVGASGAGKSTIISLVNRFYDVTAGCVMIDGQDVRSVTLASLHAHVSYIGQETFLFKDSIRNNIRAGLEASDEAIEMAARAAFAHDFIMGFDLGYDTELGEFGAGLSGGQKQRIAIARAILKNAPIMLLDEATSALDSESESFVQQALEKLMLGRTSIIIAHRLSTIVKADKILVMEEGKIIEHGTHSELLLKQGSYARMSQIQLTA
jgi:ATP-binding cassette, subfamily B, bacterial MsbA